MKNTYSKGAQILDTRLPWQLNYTWWHLTFVGPFWHLEFWGGSKIFQKSVHHWYIVYVYIYIKWNYISRIGIILV